MSIATTHRTSLRLSLTQREAIDYLCHKDGDSLAMNAWIAQAIDEKINRDSGKPKKTIANTPNSSSKIFYEFFAGGGMAREGLGTEWNCVFANDFDAMKGRVYRDNWDGGKELIVEDINKITSKNLPAQADLVWASFPCQDVSLAGDYKGIGRAKDKTQTRSGTFWPFWQLMRELMNEGRSPKLIVLENVYGILTSHQGEDFAAIGDVFAEAGYRFGAMVIDARHFLPQSRPRVFIVGVHSDIELPSELLSVSPVEPWHPERMVAAFKGLSLNAQKHWIWWNLPIPELRQKKFTDVIEDHPERVNWDSPEKTQKLLSMMSPTNLQKVQAAKQAGIRIVGGMYKRTRVDESGNKVQRAEVRFDDIAGCLRTPAGGSSRQIIIVVEGKSVRTRLLSPREAARLMGLPDTYRLPSNYNDAYHVAGDGVAVPAVRHLAKFIFEPILHASKKIKAKWRKAA